jgi:hypothetical protein
LLAVAPSAWGQGIGLALMQAGATARRSGAVVLTLHTADIVQTAMRLLRAHRFRARSRLDFSPGEDMIVKGYRLNLADTAS